MVSAEPSLADIAAAMRSGDSARAAGLADAALAQGADHPLLYQARALHLDRSGRSAEALVNFLKARELAPGDPMAANGVAICLGRMGRLKEAADAFRIALALDPGLVSTHMHMGWAFEMNQDFDAARAAYERATELAPHHAAAWAGLAGAAQANQNWQQAETAAARALVIDPRHPRVILSLAIAEVQQGKFAAAEARLRSALGTPGLVPHPLKITMLGILADALDGQDKTDEAFALYTAENDGKREFPTAQPPFDIARLVRDLTVWLERTPSDHWPVRPAGGTRSPREHIFLLGFPRSGTTLLEQVLSIHPDAVTLEESDVLDSVAEEFLRDIPSLERFLSLGVDGLARLRSGYWRRIQDHGVEVEGKFFIDKLPLNTVKLPLIAMLFPEAKVLFALRDPRDVVFSCFRRHFQVNASTYPFLTLEGAARFYDGVMALGEVCRARLLLRFHLQRHEDLVRDFEGEMRRLCAFAGLAWTERFHDFAQGARTIRSISAAQVRRGLNGDGVGQWRRYAAHLQPGLPILQPWVERFGYAPDQDSATLGL